MSSAPTTASAGSFTVNFSTPTDDSDVRSEVMTDVSSTDIDVNGGRLTIAIDFTKGDYSPGDDVTITPVYDGEGLEQDSCDLLKGAIGTEVGHALTDIRDWAKQEDAWGGGGTVGTKVWVITAAQQVAHQINVTASCGNEPDNRDGDFAAAVEIDFERYCCQD